MRNMCLGITAVVVTVGMVSVSAQGRNFSGTWVVDSEKTMAAMQTATGERRILEGGGEGGRARGTAAGAVVSAGGGGGAASGGTVARGSGGSTREIASAGGGGGVGAAGEVRAVRGGGAGGAVVSTDTVIAIDANSFSTEIGGVRTSYPLDGSEVTVPVRSRGPEGAITSEGKARASWKGDMLVIETTVSGPDGPTTSTTSWFLEGDSLVRLTTRRTYYKKK